MAPAPARQRAAQTEAGLGHPTHQRAGELAWALPTAAGAGKRSPLVCGCVGAWARGEGLGFPAPAQLLGSCHSGLTGLFSKPEMGLPLAVKVKILPCH